MSVRRREGEASAVSRVAGYAAMMPSGTRTPLDKAFMDTVMQRFPPALSPARQTRSAVEPATNSGSQGLALNQLWHNKLGFMRILTIRQLTGRKGRFFFAFQLVSASEGAPASFSCSGCTQTTADMKYYSETTPASFSSLLLICLVSLSFLRCNPSSGRLRPVLYGL